MAILIKYSILVAFIMLLNTTISGKEISSGEPVTENSIGTFYETGSASSQQKEQLCFITFSLISDMMNTITGKTHSELKVLSKTTSTTQNERRAFESVPLRHAPQLFLLKSYSSAYYVYALRKIIV
ncbi:MAG: hypothetical protein PUB21_01320 [Bacteroidales bacterium]|nr:hypothetical protein [Bacteroidales bacterium]